MPHRNEKMKKFIDKMKNPPSGTFVEDTVYDDKGNVIGGETTRYEPRPIELKNIPFSTTKGSEYQKKLEGLNKKKDWYTRGISPG